MANGSGIHDGDDALFPHIGDGPNEDTNFFAIFAWLGVLLAGTIILALVLL